MAKRMIMALALLLALSLGQQIAFAAGVAAYIQQASLGQLDGQATANAMSAKTQRGDYQKMFLAAGTKLLWAVVMTPHKSVDGVYDHGFTTQTAVDNAYLYQVGSHRLILAGFFDSQGEKIILGEIGVQRPQALVAPPVAAPAAQPAMASQVNLAGRQVLTAEEDDETVTTPALSAMDQANLASRQAKQQRDEASRGRRNVYVNGGLGLVALGGAAMSSPYVALGAGAALLIYNFAQGLGNSDTPEGGQNNADD